MKKLLIFILIVLFLVPLISPSVSADNGVPYATFTFSRSQRDLVRTQDAYVPLALTTEIGEYSLNKPADIVIDHNENVFIADTGNSRIIKFNPGAETLVPEIIGEGILMEPTGLAVDREGNLYVADIGKEEAYRFSYQVESKTYELEVTYERPCNTPLLLEGEPFKPSKITVDNGGNVYLVLAGNSKGLAQFKNDGEFFGYFGGNEIPPTFRNVIRFLLFNEEQRRKWFKMIPSPVYNTAVDQKGSLITITKTAIGYKKLNIGNTVITSATFGSDVNEDIAVGPINNVFTISEDGFIYEYSAEGNLLFIFGGRDTTSQKGLFEQASAIAVDSKNNLYALDSGKNSLQIFYPTLFANTVHQALYLYQNGYYLESKSYWENVLKMNSLFDLAHIGLGSSNFASENYEEAMDSFLLAREKGGYSEAFWEVRNIYLLNHAGTYIIILFGLLLLYLFNLKLRFMSYVGKPFSYLHNRLKKYKLYQELTFAFTLIRHPFDGFYGIKKENRTSVLSATILLFLLYSFYIASLYFTGFLFSNQLQSEINLFEESIKVLVPFGLFVIANYLVCSIREGEGRFSHVYQASVYMLAPLIIAIPFLTLISNALTLNERFIYEFGTFVTYFVVVIYIILMVKEIHNYSFSSAIGNIFLSIFTALMIAVVVFIVYLLVNEILSFLINIWIEVRSRG